MADVNPGPNEEWRNYIVDDPHIVPAAPPVGNPFAQANIPVVILDEEDDSEEEPEEEDPGEDSEEYVPYGYDGEFDSDSDTVADEIPQDAQDPVEILTDDEVTPPFPQPMSCCPEGNCPLTRRTARTYLYREPQPYRHFEVGGPSQAPPPAFTSPPPPAPVVSPPRDAPTMDQHNQVADRVLQLRDRVAEDSDALQTLYCRVGADHTRAITAGAHIGALEYRLDIAERELRSSERERLQMRSQFTELNRFVRQRLG